METWRDAIKKDEEQGSSTDPIPKGHHYLRIDKIVFGKKGGAAFTSRNGDPQIMLIFADNDGREAAQMFTLSAKARWTMSRLLSRCGAEHMLDEPADPDAFAEPTYAKSKLVGLECWAHVGYEMGDDGKEYSRVTPLHYSELPPEVRDRVASQRSAEPAEAERGAEVDAADLPF